MNNDIIYTFKECLICTYLSEFPQRKSCDDDILINKPFCKYYNLHFDSVRQIDHIHNKCKFFEEKYL